MSKAPLSLFRPLLVLAMGLFILSSPPAAEAAKADSGRCGVCAPQNVPCGGSQANMNQGCTQICGGGNAYGCKANDQDCAPLFYDGWWCALP